MIYAQLKHLVNGKPEDVLGSNGVFILDARFGKVRRHASVQDQVRRLAKVKTGIIGYTVHAGESFTNSRQVGGYVPIGDL